MRNQTHNMKKQGGIALLEALIAIFLFSLGVLALAGLQAVMSKNVTHAKYRSEAAFLANQMIGQIWVDQTNIANYAVASGTCANSYAACSNWTSAVSRMLPAGTSTVAITAGANGSVATVTIGWQLPGEAPAQFQIEANVTN